MKTLVAALMLASGALALGDEFDDRAAAAQARAVIYYPAVKDPKSALVKKMNAIDAAWKEAGDKRFYSPEKPYTLAVLAARELGIKPVAPPVDRTAEPGDTAAQDGREKREMDEREHRLRKLEKAERDRKNRERESGTFKE